MATGKGAEQSGVADKADSKEAEDIQEQGEEERFKRETLKPLPAVDTALIYPRETRVVSNDGYLSWSWSHYPLPMNLALRRVLVEPIFGRAIRDYDEKGNVAKHETVSYFVPF